MTRSMASAAMFALVTMSVVGADDKSTDGGKGSAFKSMSYQIEERGEAAVVLTFEAGKEVTVTTNPDKETDIHLTMESKDFAWEDISATPVCLLKFTPVNIEPGQGSSKHHPRAGP